MGSDTLNILDGVDSIDNTLIIATTNYPERIPDNLIDRPGRFDSLYEVGFPTTDVRLAYLKEQLSLASEVDLMQAVQMTEGYSIAYLKELVVASQIYDKKLFEIIKTFKERKAKIQKFIKKVAKQRRESIGLEE